MVRMFEVIPISNKFFGAKAFTANEGTLKLNKISSAEQFPLVEYTYNNVFKATYTIFPSTTINWKEKIQRQTKKAIKHENKTYS